MSWKRILDTKLSKITLVLFTSLFPYEGGETFLETEIKYLSGAFKNIIVVPTKKTSAIRKLPINVTLDNTIANSKTRYLYKLKSLFGKYFLSNFSFNKNEIKYLFKNAVYVENYKKWISTFLLKNDINKVLFYSYWFEAPTAALALTKTNNLNLKYITRAHGGDLYENLYNLKIFPFRQNILSNINSVFTVSETGKNHLLKKYNVTPAKIKVSYLGVESNGINANNKNKDEIKIVSCSNLIPLKRIDLIIEALKLLKNKNTKIIWTHFGDGILRKQLEEKAEENLGNNIQYRFLGFLKNKDVLEYYRTNYTDIFISTSSSEGIPVSIMEAQSFGIPVIATNVGAVNEIVNNQNGFLLNQNPTPDEIAEVISDAAINKEKWEMKRIQSFKSWQTKFNAEINYKNFINKLKEIL